MPAEEPQSTAAGGIVHSCLERMEEAISATAFLSIIATTLFFIPAVGMLITIIFFHGGPAVIPVSGTTSLAALAILWTVYRLPTRLMLAVVVIAFTATFSAFMFYWQFALVPLGPTIGAWFPFASFCIPLIYVDYLFIRAGRDIWRISDGARAILRGKTPGSMQGMLRRLFGIPEVCVWLPRQQRWPAVLMFFIATALLCWVVETSWTLFFITIPRTEHQVFETCASLAHRGGSCLLNPAYLAGVVMGALVGSAAALSMFLGASLLVTAGARYAARRFTRISLERLVSADPRPPILFLRSFRDDQVRLRNPGGNPLRRMIALGEPRPTLDHVLLEEATPLGPVIAIGAPGSTPPFGAARTYVSDAEWRDTVAEFSRNAAAIVVTIDDTEGVRWELQHLLAHNHVSKALFLVPPRLMSADALSRSLMIAFAEFGAAQDWIAGIVRIVRTEHRLCVGWFWRGDRQLELLTTRRNSYLAYLIAVRLFLAQLPEAAAARLATALPVPPPISHPDAPGVSPAPRSHAPSEPFPKVGIPLILASITALTFVVSLKWGLMAFVLALFMLLSLWMFGRTSLPRPLVPALGLAVGYSLWEIGIVIIAISTGSSSGIAFWSVDLVIILGLAGWVFHARSRAATIMLLVFQLIRLAIVLLFFLVSLVTGAQLVAWFVDAVTFACQAAASIYAIVRLKWLPGEPQTNG